MRYQQQKRYRQNTHTENCEIIHLIMNNSDKIIGRKMRENKGELLSKSQEIFQMKLGV